jgi:hypothetical protein
LDKRGGFHDATISKKKYSSKLNEYSQEEGAFSLPYQAVEFQLKTPTCKKSATPWVIFFKTLAHLPTLTHNGLMIAGEGINF